MLLKDQVAIVTGGTSGIGKGIALGFAQEGAKVVFCGRREDRGLEIAKEIQQETGSEVTFVRADCSVDSDVENLVKKTMELYGRIDILVNNAGVLRTFKFEEFDMQKDVDDVFNLNIRAYFLASKLVLQQMVKQKSGNIINIASIGGLSGGPNIASYSATKGAVLQLSRSLAKEFGHHQIRTNSISPGLIYSEMMPEGEEFTKQSEQMIPLKRGAQPSAIANAAVFLASEKASFINGANIVIDGGATA